MDDSEDNIDVFVDDLGKIDNLFCCTTVQCSGTKILAAINAEVLYNALRELQQYRKYGHKINTTGKVVTLDEMIEAV